MFLVALALIMGACDSSKVKIRGKVTGLQGTVKLLAEMPGQQGLVVLAEQKVEDGDINLVTEQLQIPARVWIDIDGKNTLETIVDSKDQIWIQGKAKFPDQIEVKGSGLDKQYNDIKKMFKEKYEGPLEPIDKKIDLILKKEIGYVVDWSKVDKEDYLLAMERSPIKDIEIKFLLKNALTDNVNDREIYMKGIDHSYYYEGYYVFKMENLTDTKD